MMQEELLIRLDIPFYVMNFRDIFKEKVIDYFVQEYIDGKNTKSMYSM